MGRTLSAVFILTDRVSLQILTIDHHSLTTMVKGTMHPDSAHSNGASDPVPEGTTTQASPSTGSLSESDILAGLPDACFILDLDWRITYANSRGMQLIQHLSAGRSGSVIGKNIRDECPELADSTFCRQCQDALEDQTLVETESFCAALECWFSIRVFPARDRLCVLFQDVSRRVALERELQQRAEELAEVSHGKDEFLQQLAHDVRNALTPVRNALHLAASVDPGSESARAVALAEHEIRYLSRLMDDLLRVSQVPTSLPNKQPIILGSIVAETVAATITGGRLGARNLTVQLPPEPLWLDADADQLRLILQHLLDNAIKFTGSSGEIRLTAERQGTDLALRIQDDGVGLSAEALPHIFKLFMRKTSGFRGGLGIGLTLVRRLVELHGGSVEAQSDGLNRGSEFIVRLPLRGETAHELAPALAPPHDRLSVTEASLRALVVDDNFDAAQSLSLLLTSWGFEIEVAYDGASALQSAEAHRPDLVLLDIGMPGMDGFEVARRLRQFEGGDEITLVALTGFGQEEYRDQARKAGFDYHMVKPVDPQDLKDLLAFVGSGRANPVTE
jgi:signal transduction histidine kinase/CheY-like chemotaxis protein